MKKLTYVLLICVDKIFDICCFKAVAYITKKN